MLSILHSKVYLFYNFGGTWSSTDLRPLKVVLRWVQETILDSFRHRLHDVEGNMAWACLYLERDHTVNIGTIFFNFDLPIKRSSKESQNIEFWTCSEYSNLDTIQEYEILQNFPIFQNTELTVEVLFQKEFGDPNTTHKRNCKKVGTQTDDGVSSPVRICIFTRSRYQDFELKLETALWAGRCSVPGQPKGPAHRAVNDWEQEQEQEQELGSNIKSYTHQDCRVLGSPPFDIA